MHSDRFHRACWWGGSLLLLVLGCDTEGTTLYDPERTSKPDPVLNAIAPQGQAFAAVDVLTLTGQNFAPSVDENFVYFEEQRGTVLEASPTQLRVLPPNVVGEALSVRVSVLGAEAFSNPLSYRLDAPAEAFGGIATGEEPFGLTTDVQGNLYMSLFTNGVSSGIKKLAPDGTRSDFITSTFKWDGLRWGPDGLLYGVRSVRAVFRYPASGGATAETWAVLPDNALRLLALDFDDGGNLWAAGAGSNLYRIDANKTVTAYPFVGTVRALKVYNGFLYAAAQQDGAYAVFRFPLTASGDLGPAETYFDFASEVDAVANIFSMAVATTGELFLGTDLAADPVVIVAPDGSWSKLHPTVLRPTAIALAWGTAPFLYMSGGRTEATEPALTRINTRREGAR
jgi:hypothetical protein